MASEGGQDVSVGKSIRRRRLRRFHRVTEDAAGMPRILFLPHKCRKQRGYVELAVEFATYNCEKDLVSRLTESLFISNKYETILVIYAKTSVSHNA